jgi:hypothetical protein
VVMVSSYSRWVPVSTHGRPTHRQWPKRTLAAATVRLAGPHHLPPGYAEAVERGPAMREPEPDQRPMARSAIRPAAGASTGVSARSALLRSGSRTTAIKVSTTHAMM